MAAEIGHKIDNWLFSNGSTSLDHFVKRENVHYLFMN
jgi:hypothetical protein